MVAFEYCVQLDYVVSASVERVEHAAKRPALHASLRDAEELLGRDDPQAVDACALMLDGLLAQLVSEWFAERGAEAPPRERALAELERAEGDDGRFAGRLRLALRAPDPHARLVQCRELLHCLNQPYDNEHAHGVNGRE